MELTNHRKGVFRRWAREFGLSLEGYLSLCETQKRCQKCKTWKPKEEFAFDKSRHDGLNVRCFFCSHVNRPHKKHILTESDKEKLREWHRNNPDKNPRLGTHLSPAHKERLRQCRIEEGKNGNGSFYGANNPNWKGGITPEIQIARNLTAYKRWRTAVFDRDNYTCRRCGDDRGGNLHAHHIKKFADFPELRYEVYNGETLCFDCHAKEHDVPNSYRKRRYARRKKAA